MLHNPLNDYNEVGQTLIKAANYMDEHGHCKHILEDHTGRVCLIGALYSVIFDSPNPSWIGINSEQVDCFDACIESLYSKNLQDNKIRQDYESPTSSHTSLVDWNNDKDRKKDEVVALFRAVAEDHKLVPVI